MRSSTTQRYDKIVGIARSNRNRPSNTSAKATRKIVFRLFLTWVDKHSCSLIELYQSSREEEPNIVCDSCCLKHIVRHNNDRTKIFQVEYQVFDLRGRQRIQCRTRFVEKKYFGSHRKSSGNTET